MTPSFYDVTISARVEVVDPVALKAASSFSGSSSRAGDDIYVPETVELALIDRFAALMNPLFQPAAGMRVWQHSERLEPCSDGSLGLPDTDR